MSVSAWETDPTGRHQYRWFDGEEWTDQVADDGVQTTDPLRPGETPGPPGRTSPQPTPSSGSPARGSDTTTRWATLKTGEQMPLASAGARLGARVIDWVVFVVVGVAVMLPLVISEDDFEDSDYDYGSLPGKYWAGIIIVSILALLYEIVLTAKRGQTLGKMATGVQVVRSDNGGLPGWGKSAGRWAVPSLVGFIPIIGWIIFLLCYVSLVWDRSRQGWHDKAAGTFVVKKN